LPLPPKECDDSQFDSEIGTLPSTRQFEKKSWQSNLVNRRKKEEGKKRADRGTSQQENEIRLRRIMICQGTTMYVRVRVFYSVATKNLAMVDAASLVIFVEILRP